MMKYQELTPALTWEKNNLEDWAKHSPKHKAPGSLMTQSLLLGLEQPPLMKVGFHVASLSWQELKKSASHCCLTTSWTRQLEVGCWSASENSEGLTEVLRFLLWGSLKLLESYSGVTTTWDTNWSFHGWEERRHACTLWKKTVRQQ